MLTVSLWSKFFEEGASHWHSLEVLDVLDFTRTSAPTAQEVAAMWEPATPAIRAESMKNLSIQHDSNLEKRKTKIIY